MIPAVAAGHPATAAAGAEILADGGTAADAAVAAALASCVAETVMTGLLGGAHAIYFDAATETARNLDCFVSVPTGAGAPLVDLPVPFGDQIVHYAIGASSCGVPGLPAGLDALWRARGSLPWARLVEPALALARNGVQLPPAHAACLAMLEPVMTMREGAAIYAPAGRILQTGERLDQPGLVRTLELLRDEGARSVYDGTIAEALLALVVERDGVLTRRDLTAYEPEWSEPLSVGFAGRSVATRGGLSGIAPTVAALDGRRGPDALLDALESPVPDGHTTNLVATDAAGNACVITSSLGLGSGDFLPGLDLHLNSMLGELDLLGEPLTPGQRMGSMMAPTLVFDADGLELALGAAGGTRLRTALVGVLSAVLQQDVPVQVAIDAPRFHPAGELVHAEPDVDEEFLARLEATGRTVQRWQAKHHYFGGVSAVGRVGAGADPRRSGAVAFVSSAGTTSAHLD